MLRTKGGTARGRLKTASRRAQERTIKAAKAKEMEVKRAMKVGTKKAAAKETGRKQSSWNKGNGKGKVCYACGKPGHVAKDC